MAEAEAIGWLSDLQQGGWWLARLSSDGYDCLHFILLIEPVSSSGATWSLRIRVSAGVSRCWSKDPALKSSLEGRE